MSCGAWTRLYSTDQTEMMDGAANIAQPDPYVVYYRVAAMSPTAVGSQSALQAFY